MSYQKLKYLMSLYRKNLRKKRKKKQLSLMMENKNSQMKYNQMWN